MMIYCARVAQAEGKDYARIMSILEREVDEYEDHPHNREAQTWADLGKKGRG